MIDTTGGSGAATQEESKTTTTRAPEKEQGQVTLQTKFISGLKADVTDNIFFLDDNQVVYPAGHNIVIYHIEEKTQKTYPCIEGSEGVTAMALSKNRRTLAVAEKSDKTPVVTIYRVDDERSSNEERKTEFKTLKKRKVICSTEINKPKSFISMAFCPKNDKLLATLSAEPEQAVHIWQVDK